MRVSVILFFAFNFLWLNSCKRDFVPPILQCKPGYNGDFDFRKCNFVDSDMQNEGIRSPTYNPTNTDEFAFVDAKGKLVKYNMATKEKQTLVDNLDRILTPDWGVSGWIVFSAGWKIWRVRADGNELKRLSFGCRDLHPVFNPGGDKIAYPHDPCYSQSSDDERMDYKIFIIDIEGDTIDFFCRPFENDPCYPWDVSDWVLEDKYVATAGPNNDLSVYGISYYNDIGEEIERVYEVKDRNYKAYPFIKDIEFNPSNGLIYFQDARGIKTVDPDNDKVRLLKKSCADESYGSFTISGDGEHIIAIKLEAWKDEKNCTIIGEYYFVRMNSNGAKEERIFIPPV